MNRACAEETGNVGMGSTKNYSSKIGGSERCSYYGKGRMRMKLKKFGGLLFLLCLLMVSAATAAEVDVDSYLEKNYDFSKIHSIYVWPLVIEALPDNLELSLPVQLDDWIDNAMRSKNVKNAFVLKPTKSVWQSVQLIYGPTEYDNPFESEESSEYFYSHLESACSAVLQIRVSLEKQRRWQEPRTETYTTTERVHSVERRRNSNGKYEYVDVYTDIPVVKERHIPGYWYTTANSSCRLEFYDTKKLNDKYIAAAHARGYDRTNSDNDRKMLTDLMKKTVDSTIASIFHKPKKR